MKTLVIGDIHGMLPELKALLAQVGPVDEIISCGDLIDRGPFSYETIKFCQENNIKVCLGNHELMAIEALTEYFDPKFSSYRRLVLEDSNWFYNGGDIAFKTFPKEELPAILDYFKSLPLFIKTPHTFNNLPIIVSHACITRATQDFDTQLNYESPLTETAVWSRQLPKPNAYFNIHGHTPTDLFDSPKVPYGSNYHLNLDTGCCYTSENRGVLSAVLLPDFKIYQQGRL